MIKTITKYAKYFLILNLVLTLIFLSFMVYKKINYGYVFEKDISLAGGTQIIIKNLSYEYVKEKIKDYKVYKINNLVYIEGKNINVTELLKILNISKEEVTIQKYSPYFGKTIFNEFFKLIVIVFALTSIIIFLRMRNIFASLGILYTLVFDFLGTLFVLSLINFEFSMMTFVSLLMILGYAIDNNIVLATNMLKEEKPFEERARMSLKVGYLMEITTILVLIVLYLFIPSKVIKDFSFVLILALLLDSYFYLFGNIPFYYLFLERNKKT